MKKINNKKAVSLYVFFFTALLVILFFSGIGLLILKPISFYIHLSVTIAIVFGLILYACLKMKTFEYESSMEVITIRQSYLWKMNSHQHPIEFPNDILIGFSINNRIFNRSLRLILKSREEKIKILYCTVTGLNKKQVAELKQSLANSRRIL